MQARAHVLHDEEEGALSFDNFEEVILNFDDVGMVQLGHNGKFSVFILGVLDDFLDCILKHRFFIDNLTL